MSTVRLLNILPDWRARWQRLQPRERRAVLAALMLVVPALAWQAAIAPAWSALRELPAQQRDAERALAQMQQQAQQVADLRARVDPGHRVDVPVELQRITLAAFGSGASISVDAGHATVTLHAAPAGRLGPWLAQLQASARARPVHISLRRNAPTDTAWSGQVVLQLPATDP